MHQSLVSRGRGALAARGTRRKYVHVGSVAASMPPHGPAIGEDTAPVKLVGGRAKNCLSRYVHRTLSRRYIIEQRGSRTALNHGHRPSRLALARPPSRDLTRHGCRVRAYTDVLAACPAMVGGQGPCSKPPALRARSPHRTGQFAGSFIQSHAHRPFRLVLARPPSRDLMRHGCHRRAYRDVLAACPATVGGQGPCSQA
ncbi:hypothetical protein CFBP7900_24400 [Xanthomonas hortorum pv. carotae]|uniref:Uncharacterized protein n=1 Tax=Xanthomonas hortorum pv. carotae TaxID=487904 RepID=A0A6V7EK76_9XANT|nr:hypothetical protein CFBP7900_24400 [Xanthomonas hortorum pv. carotae]CAD0351634.1 hypothetical protein CFBP7900_24400 [Xanthomonas hortorum pv. carotae]